MRAASLAIAAALLAVATPAAAQDPPAGKSDKSSAPRVMPHAAHADRASAPAGADAWENARLPWYAPRTLAFEEGMPLPPGYTLIRRRNRTLLAAGAAIFGASYLASALTAATVVAGHARHRSEVSPLFVPFAGPFITVATSRDAALGDPDRRTNGVLLLLDGAAQITGAALFIAGLVAREPVLVRTRDSYGVESASVGPEIVIGPRSAGLIYRF